MNDKDVTMTVSGREFQTMLSNENTILDAVIKVQEQAQAGNLIGMLDAVARSHQLILQAIKSNHALMHEIRVRNFPDEPN
ncbi:MAG TPA: hypothetical protein VFH87_07445 [Candidatus Udaeobacter sp.]|nr:hypothetical protein [Candidatus Udaeobacter sp.]